MNQGTQTCTAPSQVVDFLVDNYHVDKKDAVKVVEGAKAEVADAVTMMSMVHYVGDKIAWKAGLDERDEDDEDDDDDDE